MRDAHQVAHHVNCCDVLERLVPDTMKKVIQVAHDTRTLCLGFGDTHCPASRIAALSFAPIDRTNSRK